MLRTAIDTALVIIIFSGNVTAIAQAHDTNSQASTGSFNDRRNSKTPFDYNQKSLPGHADLDTQGWADFTNSQEAGASNGPRLSGTQSRAARRGAQSGAATSAPFQGTYNAPGNFALRQTSRQSLPPTNLSSFVRDSGMNDAIYGDEGTNEQPPYEGFTDEHRIIVGIDPVDRGLTTGHLSGAPSAWGWPQ